MKTTTIIAALALFTLVSAPAFAKGKKGGQCKEEIAALCGSVEKGEARRSCIEDNLSQLSAECQEKVQRKIERHEKRKAMKDALVAACQADAQQFCADVQDDRKALRKCMKEHASELSQTCQDTIAETKAAAKEARKGKKGKKGNKGANNACRQEVEQVCSGVEQGEGRVKACIAENLEQFSNDCQEKFAKRAKRGKLKKRLREACAADAKALCSSETSDKSMLACMKEHESELSQQCTEVINEVREARGAKGQL